MTVGVMATRIGGFGEVGGGLRWRGREDSGGRGRGRGGKHSGGGPRTPGD